MDKIKSMHGTFINSNGLCIGKSNTSLEKTADEMFEELGYKKLRDDDESYKNIEGYKKDEYDIIEFDKNDKGFYKSAIYDTTSDNISMQELQAINKKCQELGWI